MGGSLSLAVPVRHSRFHLCVPTGPWATSRTWAGSAEEALKTDRSGYPTASASQSGSTYRFPVLLSVHLYSEADTVRPWPDPPHLHQTIAASALMHICHAKWICRADGHDSMAGASTNVCVCCAAIYIGAKHSGTNIWKGYSVFFQHASQLPTCLFCSSQPKTNRWQLWVQC